MVQQLDSIKHSASPGYYQIRLQGHVGPQWREWFQGFQIHLETNGDTLLHGVVSDQAALHGIFKKVRDIGMPLISVNLLPTSQERGSGTLVPDA